MNKEQLQAKVEALQANRDIKDSELRQAQSELNTAVNELANAGKPILSSIAADELVDAIQEVFTDVLNNISTYDLDVGFCIDYGNQVTIDHIDFSNVGISESDIYQVVQDMFSVVDDEDDDNS